MLQYILNLTAIWLISLVVFDLLLKKESYHGYNRFYLLLTFFAGLLTPLWHWEQSANTAYTMLSQPIAQLIVNNQDIQATVAQTNIAQGSSWLLGIYTIGVFVAMAFLIADIVKLVRFYVGSKRSVLDKWTIVETHKEHAPFSFLNILFVSSTKLYDTDEWNMLLVHERQHASLLHFADVALMQLSRIVFWFHPLIYIYHNRLCLIHEYQADNACRQRPQVYGRFLVNQMMLQAAPSVAHALSNAPVKKRILMLTHKSPRYRQMGQLMVLPLITLFMLCFTQYDIEYQQERNTIVYHEISPAMTAPYFANFTNEPNTADEHMEPQGKQTGKPKERKISLCEAYNYRGNDRKYLNYNGEIIQLAGMENNANAKCCSSNLLWGSNYAGILSQSYAGHNAVSLAEYAGNPCTQNFDAYRNDQYIHAMENYRHMQQSLNEYAMNNTTTIDFPAKLTQIVIGDDPWNTHTDKSPGMVPQLSIDRSVFGPNVKSIFDDALAIAAPVKGETLMSPEWLSLAAQITDPRTVIVRSKGVRSKNTPYAP